MGSEGRGNGPSTLEMQSYWVAVTSSKGPSAAALVGDREGRSFLAVLYVMGTPESLLVCKSTQWWVQCSWCFLSLVSAPFCLVAFFLEISSKLFASPSLLLFSSFLLCLWVLAIWHRLAWVCGLPYFSLLTAITAKWNKEDNTVHKRVAKFRGRNTGNNKIEILYMNNWVNETKRNLIWSLIDKMASKKTEYHSKSWAEKEKTPPSLCDICLSKSGFKTHAATLTAE